MLALLLVAVALGLSNSAAALGIGVSGVTAPIRLEVGVVFGLFEVLMPLVGLVVGRHLAHGLGAHGGWIGGGLLMAIGVYGLVRGLGADRAPRSPTGRRGRLVLSGLALSVDNLVVGFALGTEDVSVVVAIVVIGAVSVSLSLIGLELGGRIGSRTGDRAESIGSAILFVVGIAVAAGLR